MCLETPVCAHTSQCDRKPQHVCTPNDGTGRPRCMCTRADVILRPGCVCTHGSPSMCAHMAMWSSIWGDTALPHCPLKPKGPTTHLCWMETYAWIGRAFDACRKLCNGLFAPGCLAARPPFSQVSWRENLEMPPLSLLLPLRLGTPWPVWCMTHPTVSLDYSWRVLWVPYMALLSGAARPGFPLLFRSVLVLWETPGWAPRRCGVASELVFRVTLMKLSGKPHETSPVLPRWHIPSIKFKPA